MLVVNLLFAAAVLVAAPYAVAQSTDHQAHHVDQSSAASEMAEGEVRKVDKDAGKITLQHGELKSLEMPPMTMVFQMEHKALLDKVKAGDKIRFAAKKSGASSPLPQSNPTVDPSRAAEGSPVAFSRSCPTEAPCHDRCSLA